MIPTFSPGDLVKLRPVYFIVGPSLDTPERRRAVGKVLRVYGYPEGLSVSPNYAVCDVEWDQSTMSTFQRINSCWLSHIGCGGRD